MLSSRSGCTFRSAPEVGTKDPTCGIPVSPGQISGAHLVVETDIAGKNVPVAGRAFLPEPARLRHRLHAHRQHQRRQRQLGRRRAGRGAWRGGRAPPGSSSSRRALRSRSTCSTTASSTSRATATATTGSSSSSATSPSTSPSRWCLTGAPAWGGHEARQSFAVYVAQVDHYMDLMSQDGVMTYG